MKVSFIIRKGFDGLLISEICWVPWIASRNIEYENGRKKELSS